MPLTPWFFDVLHVDGEDLLGLPLSERVAALERGRAGALAGAASARRRPSGASPPPRSPPATRASWSRTSTRRTTRAGAAASWRKVKPVHTLDLVVLAAEWGHGRRTGRLSNLHLGARDPAGGFVMLGKTFKGLTDELLAWQTAALLERQVSTDGWTVLVRPELVVEIAVDGVQTSPRYPGGMALRFARVVRYRPDKTPDQADTVDDVRRLHLSIHPDSPKPDIYPRRRSRQPELVRVAEHHVEQRPRVGPPVGARPPPARARSACSRCAAPASSATAPPSRCRTRPTSGAPLRAARRARRLGVRLRARRRRPAWRTPRAPP